MKLNQDDLDIIELGAIIDAECETGYIQQVVRLERSGYLHATLAIENSEVIWRYTPTPAGWIAAHNARNANPNKFRPLAPTVLDEA